MLLKAINKSPRFRKWVSSLLMRWVEKKTASITKYLYGSILDIGCGNGLAAKTLMEKGYSITPIDIKNLSISPIVLPIVYDGKHLPFSADTFDTALLLTVLHHSDDPEQLLLESKRVAKSIVIIEDTYQNQIQKIATQFIDLVINLGFSKMTFKNKSEKQWEQLFDRLELKVSHKQRKTVLFFFQQTTYHLKNYSEP